MFADCAVVVLLAVVTVGDAKKKQKVCEKGWECSGSICCCNETISEYFQVYQFEDLFSKRNAPTAHAVGFSDYQSFITAAAVYEPLGFGNTGGKQMGMKEVAAFLGHVGSKTSSMSSLPSSSSGHGENVFTVPSSAYTAVTTPSEISSTNPSSRILIRVEDNKLVPVSASSFPPGQAISTYMASKFDERQEATTYSGKHISPALREF